MYRALAEKDAGFDGIFWVGVRTTGIFCRPTCTAKLPKAENVEYFRTPAEALHAGFRPCKRCHPMDAAEPAPKWVLDLFDKVEQNPNLPIGDSDLAAMNIEPARARRYFKRRYGMTFHAYHRARRMGMAFAAIRKGENMCEAGLDAGFESTSGFRDAFVRLMGEPPGKFREKDCLYGKWLETPLGPMLAVASEEGLCLLEFMDRRALETELIELRQRLGAPIMPGDNIHLQTIKRDLTAYFARELREFTLPLVLRGTPFQKQVWELLMRIPYGETWSYGQMAEKLGRPDAQRAVGAANGDNRMAIIIPCHRVIRSDGSLCGYGGGLWRKKWLLDHEQGLMPLL